MRSLTFSALKLSILAFGLAWILHVVPLSGQTVPASPNSFLETSYPVGDPVLLAARAPLPNEPVKTNPPDIRMMPESEWQGAEKAPKPQAAAPKTSWFSKFKKPKKKKEEILTDDGLEAVEWMNSERNFTNRDYVESATRHKSTSVKDDYRRGLQAENQGNLDAAVRHYHSFIKANSTETTNGILAAPYHRLALIGWKQQRNRESSIYFRYAMKYALGGNIAIIAGDYSLFLMEQGEIEKAEVMLRNALAYSPENPRLLMFLGRCLARQHRPIEALRHLSAAVGEEQAYVEMAQVYRQAGEWETARVVEEKQNEYLAEKRRRSMPVQNYVYQPRPTYPVPVAPPTPAVRPTPPNRSAASPVAVPATTVSASPATPVSMLAPNIVMQPPAVYYQTPVYQTPYQTPGWNVPAPQAYPMAGNPATTPFIAVPQPMVAPEAVPRNSSMPEEGWHPHVPAAPTAEVSGTGVFHYPAGLASPVYYEDPHAVSHASRSRYHRTLNDPPPTPPQIGANVPGYPR